MRIILPQILSVTDDLSVFDAGSFQSDEFYSLLYELLCQPPQSEVVWYALSVVQVAVRNPSACAALSQTYHCIPPLTALLDSQLYPAKRSTVLKVIQVKYLKLVYYIIFVIVLQKCLHALWFTFCL